MKPKLVRCCVRGWRNRWDKFEKHSRDSQMECLGRIMEKGGKKFGCLPCFCGLVFTVVIKNIAQILGKILGSYLRCLWDIQMELSKEGDVVSISRDRELGSSFPNLGAQFHSSSPARHASTPSTADMWTQVQDHSCSMPRNISDPSQ